MCHVLKQICVSKILKNKLDNLDMGKNAILVHICTALIRIITTAYYNPKWLVINYQCVVGDVLSQQYIISAFQLFFGK